MKRKLLAVFLILCMTFCISGVGVYGADTIWQNETTMPTLRTDYSVSVVGSKIYVIGGYVDNSKMTGIVEVYNTKTKTWETKSPMLSPKRHASAVVVGNEIYVIGGELESLCPSGDVQIYDTRTDSWRAGKTMPRGHYNGGAEVVGNKIYVFGGQGHSFSQTSAWMDVYNIDTEMWTRALDIPKAAYDFSHAALNGKIYIIGGRGTELFQTFNNVQIFDPSTGAWTTGANMPTARSGMDCEVVDGKIYVIAGYGTNGAKHSKVEIYDPISNTWDVGPAIDFAREEHKTALVGGRVYVVGGYNLNAASYVTSVISLQIGEPTIPEEPAPEPPAYNLSVFLNTGEQSQFCVTEFLEDNATIAWTSSNETVATVNNNGKVTAVSAGTCDISAQSSGGTFNKSIPVRVMDGQSGGSDVVFEKVNDNDSRITYSGAWTPYSNDPSFYNNDEHFSNQKDSYAEFTFEGTGINWIGATSDNLGICDVYIDGELEQAGLDQYSSSLEAQKVLFSKTGLPNGQHTIKIVITGEKNSNSADVYGTVDAFEVLRNSNTSR